MMLLEEGIRDYIIVMGKDRDSKGSSSALEMLVSRRSDRKQKDKKDRKVLHK